MLLGALAAGLALSASAVLGWTRDPAAADQAATQLIAAAGMGLVVLLAVPSVVLSLLRLIERPAPGWASRPWIDIHAAPRRTTVFLLIVILWGLAITAGSWAANQAGYGQLALAPLFALVVGLPVAAYLVLGAGGLAGGSPQRRWGILGAGLAGTSLVVLLVELLTFGLVAVALLVLLASQPDSLINLNRLVQRIANAQITPENLGRILRPYLQPWLVFAGVAIVSGLAPLIEELLKPLPLWLFSRRALTPAEGFVGGLLCGAGFALFESLGDLVNVTGQSWAVSAVGRAGTDLLHMVNTGLMGWALALAWTERRYLRLALTYLLVVGIHGLWNTISLAVGLLPLVTPAQAFLRQPGISTGLVAALVAMYLGLLILLITANRQLARTSAPGEPVGENPA